MEAAPPRVTRSLPRRRMDPLYNITTTTAATSRSPALPATLSSTTNIAPLEYTTNLTVNDEVFYWEDPNEQRQKQLMTKGTAVAVALLLTIILPVAFIHGP